MGGLNFRWPSNGAMLCFSYFSYDEKQKILPNGGHGRFGQGVNMPLVQSTNPPTFKRHP